MCASAASLLLALLAAASVLAEDGLRRPAGNETITIPVPPSATGKLSASDSDKFEEAPRSGAISHFPSSDASETTRSADNLLAEMAECEAATIASAASKSEQQVATAALAQSREKTSC